jgi:hypothetical protein
VCVGLLPVNDWPPLVDGLLETSFSAVGTETSG